ncbi:restriction endonuclease [Micromonospora sp. SD12]|uniref:restriction endonuclease n=1 Tax=Micromonospora sp. SD12 TaxID=3452216 RepID=UPI003F8BA168
MQGRPEGAPPPRKVEDWAAAEANAVAWMQWLGHRDARQTKRGADGGIDVIAMGAFAQVKWYGKAIGPRPLRELAGARANRPGTLYFFVNSRYTEAALDYAGEVGMAAFVYSPADGLITPVSSAAWRIFQSAADGSRTDERRSRPAADPTAPPRQRQQRRSTGPSATAGTRPASRPGERPGQDPVGSRQHRSAWGNPSPSAAEYVSSEHPLTHEQVGEMLRHLRQKGDARVGADPEPPEPSVVDERRDPPMRQPTVVAGQPEPSASGCFGTVGLGALALAVCGYGATDDSVWPVWLAVCGTVALVLSAAAHAGSKRRSRADKG